MGKDSDSYSIALKCNRCNKPTNPTTGNEHSSYFIMVRSNSSQ